MASTIATVWARGARRAAVERALTIVEDYIMTQVSAFSIGLRHDPRRVILLLLQNEFHIQRAARLQVGPHLDCP